MSLRMVSGEHPTRRAASTWSILGMENLTLGFIAFAAHRIAADASVGPLVGGRDPPATGILGHAGGCHTLWGQAAPIAALVIAAAVPIECFGGIEVLPAAAAPAVIAAEDSGLVGCHGPSSTASPAICAASCGVWMIGTAEHVHVGQC